MYDVALSVRYCLQAGTRVDIGWLVDVRGLEYRRRADALVLTPGGGRIGSVLAGALDDQLADRAAQATTGRLVELQVTEFEAALAGLPSRGVAQCLVLPASALPGELWDRLLLREPVCLVTQLDGDQVVATSLFTRETIKDAPPEAIGLFGRGTTDTARTEDTVITALWAVPRLVIVGGGPIADALEAQARLLGWAPQLIRDPSDLRMIADLGAADGLVVATHDEDLDRPALAQALSSRLGYIGALGPGRLQRARAEWLAERAIEGAERIHGPAGLDIGARTPAEIAVAIIAEMLRTVSS